jgi:cytochrome c oxidase cbb3-type subunit 1
LEASAPGYVVRFIGGAIFLSGMLIMAYNVFKTAQQAKEQQAHKGTQEEALA